MRNFRACTGMEVRTGKFNNEYGGAIHGRLDECFPYAGDASTCSL